MRRTSATMLKTLGILLLSVLSGCGIQSRALYYPRPYPAPPSEAMGSRGREVRYVVDGCQGVSYYISPSAGGNPTALWLMFGGNASRAIDWLGLTYKCPNPNAGFLLIEYPGYGQSQGSASPESILKTTFAALNQLKVDGVVDPDRVSVNVLGHSLGCAAALQFAAQRPVDNIILLSPFTSMSDLARHVVGIPVCWLLTHRYDNVARLQEISAQKPQPWLTILHGDDDEAVPVQMSRSLAERFKGWAQYHEVHGSDHNQVITMGEPLILSAMAR